MGLVTGKRLKNYKLLAVFTQHWIDFRPPEQFDRTLRSHGTVPIQHVQECSQTSPQRPAWAQKKVAVRFKYRTQFMLSAAV